MATLQESINALNEGKTVEMKGRAVNKKLIADNLTRLIMGDQKVGFEKLKKLLKDETVKTSYGKGDQGNIDYNKDYTRVYRAFLKALDIAYS